MVIFSDRNCRWGDLCSSRYLSSRRVYYLIPKKMDYEKVFDLHLYDKVFSFMSQVQCFLVTLFFARKKSTGECFLSIETLEQIETVQSDTDDKQVRAFRSVIKNLNGSAATKCAMERLSQIINKTPRCLGETFEAIVNHRPEASLFINIFSEELMFLMDESIYMDFPKDFCEFVACLLLDVAELYELTDYYRAEEFLFFVRNKFIRDLEGVHLMVNYYLALGHPQLAVLNKGGFFMDDMPKILEGLVKKMATNEGRPREVFENLLSKKHADSLLPNFDCF